ncbi:MAG: DUF488 domain-containing protein [Nitrospira sp.]|nr:DUF488 domain-containing protein [Nitrospira sp.]
MKVFVKRIYEPANPADGFRVLVDRLWPRGVAKAAAKLDEWMPDLGPSTALRRWFNHDPARWTEFCRRYYEELKTKDSLITSLFKQAGTQPITLLYSAKDERHNQAVALQSFLLKNPRFSQSLVPPKTTAEIAPGKKRRKSRSP